MLSDCKILNLYAGIGGNRKLWDCNNITAVELDENIAAIYKDFFPNDKVIVGDAHDYLLDHFSEFDFIWSSPPCPTHSRTRTMQKKKIYPDMALYQEIIFLSKWFKGKYIVENVIPYYKPLITPNMILHRHCIWNNFSIRNIKFKKLETCKKRGERDFLQKEFNFNIEKYSGIDKRKILRNCVIPEMGLHILNCAMNEDIVKEEFLFARQDAEPQADNCI